MALLIPGMAVGVEGSWEGKGFRLQQLKIVAPARFAYYRGPGAAVDQGSYRALELWAVEDGGTVRTLALRAAPEGASVVLVAYGDGGSASWPCPQGFGPLLPAWRQVGWRGLGFTGKAG